MQITHISYFLPEKTLTNDDLAIEYESNWNSKKIYKKTGIKSRHIAATETTSQLAVRAAEKLFSESGFPKDKIDFLLLCTQSPDYFLPTTACIVQDILGLPTSCGAFDFNLGCSGFVYGLAITKGLIAGGMAKNVLLLTVETYTKYIHPKDKSVRTIFGDGAAATLITHEEGDPCKIGEFVFGTDGKGASNLIVPAGAMAMPKSEETAKERVDEQGNVRSLNNLYMNGPEIFNFTLDIVPDTVKSLLAKAKLSMDDIDLFVFHQANKFMLDSLRDKIGIPDEKFYLNMEDKGNTVSATIPIAMKDALDEGRIRRGDKLMLVGFGVGYSWAGCIVEW
ncbi:3-oxoacyl-ACP synthase III family protein [Acetomicrobium sp.]|jgi:3-oxoacyl-[acyl-carrier-protein] synthase-3|uniref:3-oxoacyl-ACP synthase III family protein n=1 Tax=Acetomicrobium sp. TaxID=1872099 RepID=UPI003D954057